jgi:hypothetical protein
MFYMVLNCYYNDDEPGAQLETERGGEICQNFCYYVANTLFSKIRKFPLPLPFPLVDPPL